MGTTAEKLTYLDTTKQNLKTVINATGATLDNEDTFRSYANVLNTQILGAINGTVDLFEEYPKSEPIEGTSLILNDTILGRIKLLNLSGNTTQGNNPTATDPQTIHVASGANSITICNKNLFDKTKVTTGYINADGTISFNDSYVTTDYILIDSSSQYSKTATNSPRVKLYDDNKNLLSTGSYSDISSFGNEGTYTISNENAKYIRFTIRVSEGYSDVNTVMFVKGSTLPLSYKPYISQTYPITLPSGMEMCSVGTYSDIIFKNELTNPLYDDSLTENAWYLIKKIGKVTLNGNESSWTYQSTQTRFRLQWSIGANSSYLGFCNNYVVDHDLSNDFTVNIQSGYCFIKDSRYTSSSSFKAWLSENNTIIYYQLETPTYTEITDSTLLSQLNDLEEKISSYQDETNITQTNTDLPIKIKLSTLLDLEV